MFDLRVTEPVEFFEVLPQHQEEKTALERGDDLLQRLGVFGDPRQQSSFILVLIFVQDGFRLTSSDVQPLLQLMRQRN